MTFEGATSQAMAKEKPAADSASRMQWDNGFGAEDIEGPTEQFLFPAIARVMEMPAVDKVCMALEPADQRIVVSIFKLVGLAQATHAALQPVILTAAAPQENPQSCDLG